MKTTLNIDDTVMTRLKERAARERTTISALVETALRDSLEQSSPPVDLPPLPTFHGGAFKVNIDDGRALRDFLDREKDEKLYGHVHGRQQHPDLRRKRRRS